LDLRNTLLTTTLTKQDPCSRSVSKDVATDGLATICTSKESACSRIALDLIGQEDRDVELCTILVTPYIRSISHRTFSDVGQLREELVELLLSLVELATTGVVDTEESHDTVDDEEAVLVADEELGDFVQELHLVLGVDGASVSNVVLGCMVSAILKASWDVAAYQSRGRRRIALQSELFSQV
jgi:hypothetical protein